jgi:hypothetical protein
MKPMVDPAFVMRDAILALLSNEEVADVATDASAQKLRPGDEYLDLEHVELGVRQASGLATPSGYVLARSAVSDVTWRRIVTTLLPQPVGRGTKPAR